MPRRPALTDKVILPIRLELERIALRHAKATRQKQTHISRKAGLSMNYMTNVTSRQTTETAPLDSWVLLLLAAGCTITIHVTDDAGMMAETIRATPDKLKEP
jgi:hypothetical protein